MAAATTSDGGSEIKMDGGSGNGQRWRNGWQNGTVIAMGDGTSTATTAAMTENGNNGSKQ